MDFLKVSDKTTTTNRSDSLFGLQQQKDSSFVFKDMDIHHHHHLITPRNGVLGCYYYYPFTNDQLKELERQAMIYKYMIASIPVPFDLLVSSSPSPSCIKNVNGDLEPGRCRRTDGKKWRCSREVVSNHKYCERHLHRGRPRSRKLVEQPYARNNGGSDKSKTSPKKVSSLLSTYREESRGSKIFSVPATTTTTTEEDNKYLNFIDIWSDQLRGSEKQSSTSSPVSSVNGNLSLYSLDLSMGGNNYDEMSRIQMGLGHEENPVYTSYGTLGGPLAEILRPNPSLDFSGLESTTEPLFTNVAGDRESCSLATNLTRSSSPCRAMKKRNGSVSDGSS